MSAPLAEMTAKLNRADESLRTFDAELAEFSRTRQPVKVAMNLDFQTGWHTAYVRDHEPLPPRFAVLIGESLYQGRSFLEHLVWALVKANRNTPGRHHTFPIWDHPPRVSGRHSTADTFTQITSQKQLAGVPEEAIRRIEGLQPYNFPNPPAFCLSILNRMARDDRHHAIHASFVGGRGVSEMEKRFRTTPGVHITAFESLMRDGQDVVPGTMLARFRVSRYGRRARVRMEGGVPIFIAFGDRSKAELVLLEDFKRINIYLREVVIGGFAQFL
jgi:hypothetical protein